MKGIHLECLEIRKTILLFHDGEQNYINMVTFVLENPL